MSFLEDQLEDSFFEAYNMGREVKARVESLERGVWSAILDGDACDFCEWANGRTFAISESHINPPAHFGCRCIIAYYNDEVLDEGEAQLFLPWSDPPSELFPFGSKKGK